MSLGMDSIKTLACPFINHRSLNSANTTHGRLVTRICRDGCYPEGSDSLQASQYVDSDGVIVVLNSGLYQIESGNLLLVSKTAVRFRNVTAKVKVRAITTGCDENYTNRAVFFCCSSLRLCGIRPP